MTSRVFAVLSANKDEVQFLGFGTYVGDHPRPGTPERFSDSDYKMAADAVRRTDAQMADLDTWPLWEQAIEEGKYTREEGERKYHESVAKIAAERQRPIEERAHDLLLQMARNPKIELDNGDVVWGYQCWWGPEERWPEISAGRTVREVRIGEVLAQEQA